MALLLEDRIRSVRETLERGDMAVLAANAGGVRAWRGSMGPQLGVPRDAQASGGRRAPTAGSAKGSPTAPSPGSLGWLEGEEVRRMATLAL